MVNNLCVILKIFYLTFVLKSLMICARSRKRAHFFGRSQSMAKAKMYCPISHGVCVECSIYRGRHYYLCYAPKYREKVIEMEKLKEMLPGQNAKEDMMFGMPEVVELGSHCIKNVEEIVERREL